MRQVRTPDKPMPYHIMMKSSRLVIVKDCRFPAFIDYIVYLVLAYVLFQVGLAVIFVIKLGLEFCFEVPCACTQGEYCQAEDGF